MIAEASHADIFQWTAAERVNASGCLIASFVPFVGRLLALAHHLRLSRQVQLFETQGCMHAHTQCGPGLGPCEAPIAPRGQLAPQLLIPGDPRPQPRLPTVTALRMRELCPGAQQGLLSLFELPDCPHSHPQPSALLCLPVAVAGNSRCWDNKSCFRSQGCCQAQLHSD